MRNVNTERIGVYAVALLFTKEIDWIFREQPLVDVGIDALIEQKINGEPSGKYISAQIKTGQGNFYESKSELTLYVTKIHYNYWLNSNLPVIIIAHLPEIERTTWEVANEKTFIKTASQWKIQIPKSKNLDKNSIGELNRIISNTKQTDFELRVLNEELNQSEIDQIVENANLSNKCIESLNAISNLMSKLGKETSYQQDKINRYVNEGLSDSDKRVTRAVKDFSKSMNSITYKLNEKIEEFAFYFAKVFKAQEKISILVFHLEQDYIALQDLLDILVKLKPNIQGTIDAMKYLRNCVSGLPKKYSHLKKARLNFLEVSNQIIKEFKLADKMNDSLIKTLENKLG